MSYACSHVSTTLRCSLHAYRAGVNASQKGSWRVIGNSGSKGAHTILFANDLVLFMERPNWGIRAEPNPYLTVRVYS